MMLGIMGMNAQGTFGLKEGDAGVASGTTETSIENITMTWGVNGGKAFKGGNKKNGALNELLGATAYCEGNEDNGNLNDGVYSGTVYLFAPEKAGNLTVGVVLNSGKSFYVKEGTDGTDVDFSITKADGTEVILDEQHKSAEKITGGIVTFNVEAGKTYAVYCTGSKLGYYGFKYELSAEPAESVTANFDFSDPNFRSAIGTAMTDVAGYIYNETFPVDGVTLQITAGSAPSRIYVDNNRGQCLVTYKEFTTLTFRAPEGKAITKIEFTAAGNSNINNFTASSGAIEGMIWTGNAGGVRFLQGGTSYLAKAIVTVEGKTAETAVLAPIEYTECANIAAFNALEAGTYAKVTLKDAEVTGKSADGYSTVWIQDATGGCWIQYTTLNGKLQEKTKVNGTVYVMARPNSGNVQMKEAEDTPKSEIASAAISDYTIVSGTIDQVNVAANLNKVVVIKNATLEETSATAGKLTQGESSIDVNNGTATANQQLHKIAEWAEDTKLEGIDMVAILVGKSATANQLLPISIESTITDGISTVTANSDKVNIFNLQGQRMNSMQKGLYIVNGKKIIIK